MATLTQMLAGLFSPGAAPGAKLPGAPAHVEGPVPEVAKAAEDYASRAGIDLRRQRSYAQADPRRGRYIAKAYEKMPHAPDDPKVKAAYDALGRETMAQWRALQEAGAKIDFIKPGMDDPYPGGPREALADLRANHHLWVFPSEQGFGSLNEIADNPLLAPTGETVGGHPMLVNDAFRAVHDYFGHGMEGANFGARGEENAWRAHQRLFSPEALPALTSETRGQNSWVNFGPYGEANRANQRETVFADQKTGLMPAWTQRESGMPLSYRAQQVATPLAVGAAGLAAGSAARPEEGESWSPTDMPAPSRTVPVEPFGALSAPEPGVREALRGGALDLASRAGLPAERARYMADVATDVADVLPGVGESIGVAATGDELQRGNYGAAALEAGGAALGAVPLVGDIAGKALSKSALRDALAQLLRTRS